jgi:1,4-dihydroxy-2-naphthoate octaprenyltransferase
MDSADDNRITSAGQEAPGLLGVARPNFLLLPPICVSLGIATAYVEGATVQTASLVVALIGAIAAHVAVNALNEYADFSSGLDLRTNKTTFSGGSGTLVARPDLALGARALGYAAVFVTVICGFWLVWSVGSGVLVFGVLGLALLLAYTGPLLRYRWLVLIAPGLGFGPLMILGSHYVAAQSLAPLAIAASLLVFFLVNNLLLLNQFPDREADVLVGRDNLVIHDVALAARVYGLFVLAAAACVVAMAYWQPFAVAALLPLGLTIKAWRSAANFNGDVAPLLPAMGMNVAATLLSPLLATLGLLVPVWLA